MTRILIADDHTLVREGLKQILSATPGLEVVAEAMDGDQALAHVRSTEFDLALLDMSMPGLSGIDLIKRLKLERPKLRILVLSMHGEQQYAVRAFKAGASGYLTKDSASDQLVAAIRKIAAGGVYISAAAAEQLAMGAMDAPGELPHRSLSDREFEVFRLLVAGTSITDIADGLHLSVKTVSTHKTRILQKMNMASTAELVRYAVENKLVDAGV
ncbi:MAG: response regulator transcription factor [Betaproteobacteria bacterium]|jgi:DNA-binding NarL/FixJ family response regulator|nr:DNA-binding response regulator [Betaproteobacteria bacterium]